MSNAKLVTPVSSKGSKTMNDSIYHIIRVTLLSVISLFLMLVLSLVFAIAIFFAFAPISAMF